MQTSVALSSMESEYMAASAAAEEALWLNRLLQQLGLHTPNPTVLYEDNKAAILFADHPSDYRRSKHIVRPWSMVNLLWYIYQPQNNRLMDCPKLYHFRLIRPYVLTNFWCSMSFQNIFIYFAYMLYVL